MTMINNTPLCLLLGTLVLPGALAADETAAPPDDHARSTSIGGNIVDN